MEAAYTRVVPVKVVARYLDGRVVKGQTDDFGPLKPGFHITVREGTTASSPPINVKLSELKAVFFVRDLQGDSAYTEFKAFAPDSKAPGRKIQVLFVDGETMVGTTQAYQPDRLGFFMIPVDSKSNNERCFIVTTSVKSVSFI